MEYRVGSWPDLTQVRPLAQRRPLKLPRYPRGPRKYDDQREIKKLHNSNGSKCSAAHRVSPIRCQLSYSGQYEVVQMSRVLKHLKAEMDSVAYGLSSSLLYLRFGFAQDSSVTSRNVVRI